MARLSLMLVGFVVFLAALGCGSSEPTSGGPTILPKDPGSKNGPPGGIPGGKAGGASSGNTVFDNNCQKCHMVAAGAPDPMKKAPNLSKVGAEHKAEWIAEYVKNPSKTKADAKMPEFGSKLSAEDIKSVSEFLAGKK